MFEGHNSMRLNRAAMCTAVAEYFNKRVTADRDKLMFDSVTFDSNGAGTFVFTTQPEEVPRGAQTR